LRMRGLLCEKRRVFVFCMVDEVEPLELVLDIDDMLTDIPNA